MNKTLDILKKICIAIAIWYGSQFATGLVIGTIGRLVDADYDVTISVACIIGVIVSIIAEIFYIIKTKNRA